jgi:cytochrome b561
MTFVPSAPSAPDAHAAQAPNDPANAHRRHPARALPLAAAMHWISAFAVLVLFVFGVLMTQIGRGPVANWLYSAHKTLGAFVIVLLGARLLYRCVESAAGRWRGGRGRAVHWLIYGVALSVGLLGWAAVSDFGARGVFFGLSLPSIWPEGAGHSVYFFPAHAWLAFLLMALVVVHIGVAVNDYVTRRTDQA